MRAIRIHKYGGPEVLKYEEAPRPKQNAAEVTFKLIGKKATYQQKKG